MSLSFVFKDFGEIQGIFKHASNAFIAFVPKPVCNIPVANQKKKTIHEKCKHLLCHTILDWEKIISISKLSYNYFIFTHFIL